MPTQTIYRENEIIQYSGAGFYASRMENGVIHTLPVLLDWEKVYEWDQVGREFITQEDRESVASHNAKAMNLGTIEYIPTQTK